MAKAQVHARFFHSDTAEKVCATPMSKQWSAACIAGSTLRWCGTDWQRAGPRLPLNVCMPAAVVQLVWKGRDVAGTCAARTAHKCLPHR